MTLMRSRRPWRARCRKTRLLSHDLLEGIFARAALATDIELFEEFPSHYEASAARQHRWARGDWQLLPWIFGHGGLTERCRHACKHSRDQPLENAGQPAPDSCPRLPCSWRWSAGWLVPRHVAVGMDAIHYHSDSAYPRCCPFLVGLEPPLGRNFQAQLFSRSALRLIARRSRKSALTITFLAYQAWLMSDAILRTLGRLFSRRNLLNG